LSLLRAFPGSNRLVDGAPPVDFEAQLPERRRQNHSVDGDFAALLEATYRSLRAGPEEPVHRARPKAELPQVALNLTNEVRAPAARVARAETREGLRRIVVVAQVRARLRSYDPVDAEAVALLEAPNGSLGAGPEEPVHRARPKAELPQAALNVPYDVRASGAPVAGTASDEPDRRKGLRGGLVGRLRGRCRVRSSG
jgi:hypothetical protein